MPNVALRYRGRGGGASLGEDVCHPRPSAGCWRRPASQLGRIVLFFFWFKRGGFIVYLSETSKAEEGGSVVKGASCYYSGEEEEGGGGDAPVARCAAVAF